jgi:hypothetical protein
MDKKLAEAIDKANARLNQERADKEAAISKKIQEEAPPINVRRYLDVSTANLTQAECEGMEQSELILTRSFEYGAWVYVGSSKPGQGQDIEAIRGDFPNLAAVMDVARKFECTWILFDCDGPEIDGLPVFDW